MVNWRNLLGLKDRMKMVLDDIPTLVDIETRVEVIDFAANKAKPGSVLVEVGVFMGGTIFRLAQRIKERGISCSIYAIDDFKYSNLAPDSFKFANLDPTENFLNLFKRNSEALGLAKLINIILKKSIEASSNFQNESIDFLFLDGDHSYPHTLQELKVWWPKIKKGGVLAGHDLPGGGIKKAVDEYFNGKYEQTSNGASYIVIK